MRLPTSLLLAASLAAVPVSAPMGQTHVGPNDYMCLARHPETDQMVATLHGVQDDAFWGNAKVFRNGSLMIVYGTLFFELPPVMQRMVQHHECGHFDLQTGNEFEANCYALRRLAGEGLLTPANVSLIRHEHCSLGPQHKSQGGSGVAYWEGTRRICSELNLPPC